MAEREGPCDACGIQRTLHYRKACNALVCEDCMMARPLGVVDALVRMRRRVQKREAKWRGVKVIE